MSVIELRAVAKRFGATPVLADVDVDVPAGSITAILGASGSGKTTLLRLIAGFERLDTGTIAIGGRVVDDGRRTIRPQHRGVGYVPQDGALFPHLTVLGNIAFGLPRRQRTGVPELIEIVGLAGLERRYPHQLSGGQQQRVALARALAIRPSVVLLDEPFSSLDASLRVGLRRDIARILQQTGSTTILVTHDQDEALALADRIALLNDGQILACADPRALYGDPSDLAVAGSIGDANILLADIEADRARCALGTLRVRGNGRPPPAGACRVLLRPEQLALHLQPKDGMAQATVLELAYHGHEALAYLTLNHPGRETLLARVSGRLRLSPGQDVWVEATEAVLAWPA